MIFLIANWRWMSAAAAACLLTYAVMSQLHRWDVAVIEDKHREAMDAQEVEIISQCSKAQKLTKEVADGLQNKLAGLERQLAVAKRVRPNTCVPVNPSNPAGGGNAGAENQKLYSAHGVYSDTLLDFAYDAEVVGSRLDSCQEFVNRLSTPEVTHEGPEWWEFWK